MNITIISSSTRIGRLSTRAALALEKKFNEKNLTIQLIDLASVQIHVFNEPISRQVPPHVELKKISEQLKASDAIVFVSPEYNGGYAPALKNMVDFLSKEEFSKKPIGVVSVSSGAMGGMRAALQMQQLVLALFAFPVPHMLLVPDVETKFDEHGNSIDPVFEKKTNFFITEFLWLANAVSEAKKK